MASFHNTWKRVRETIIWLLFILYVAGLEVSLVILWHLERRMSAIIRSSGQRFAGAPCTVAQGTTRKGMIWCTRVESWVDRTVACAGWVLVPYFARLQGSPTSWEEFSSVWEPVSPWAVSIDYTVSLDFSGLRRPRCIAWDTWSLSRRKVCLKPR